MCITSDIVLACIGWVPERLSGVQKSSATVAEGYSGASRLNLSSLRSYFQIEREVHARLGHTRSLALKQAIDKHRDKNDVMNKRSGFFFAF